MGMFDKRRFRKLLLFIMNFDERNPRTYQDIDPNKTTTRDLFCRFDLGLEVMEFTGHAIALHRSDRSVRWEMMTLKLKLAWSYYLCPGDLLVTWISHVWKPSDGSSCTPSPWPATAPVHISTLCTGWEKYLRDLPGYRITLQSFCLSQKNLYDCLSVMIPFFTQLCSMIRQRMHSLRIEFSSSYPGWFCVFQTECRVRRDFPAEQGGGWDSDGQRQSEGREVWWEGKKIHTCRGRIEKLQTSWYQ